MNSTQVNTAEQAKHTPGPWRYEAGTKTIRAVPSNYWLATMDCWDAAINNEANARLIAAAPELLAACKLAFNNIPLSDEGPAPDSKIVTSVAYWRTARESIKNAIAKAEGRES